MNNQIHNKVCQVTVIGVFVLIIAIISIVSLILPAKVYSEQENRYLAQLPKFSWQTLVNGKFGQDLETALADQFPLRDDWIAGKTLLSMSLMKNEINGVYIGYNGYLIERHTDDDIVKEQADKNYTALLEFVNKYKDKGFNSLTVMPIPTAEEILTNKLPFYANGFDQSEWLNDLQEDLNKNDVADVLLNITDSLKEHNSDYLYYRTDHHWTALGAYYGYQQYMKSLGMDAIDIFKWNKEAVTDKFYGTLYSKVHMTREPDTITLVNHPQYESYKVTYNMGEKISDTMYEYGKLNTKDKYAVYFGGNPALTEIETGAEEGRSLIVIKDSYANSMVPFLIPHFDKITVVDLRYFNISVQNYIDTNEFTDILVLYNIPNLLTENTVTSIGK